MIFQERTYSVLIVTATDSFTEKIMPLLPVTDYWPVTVVRYRPVIRHREQRHGYLYRKRCRGFAVGSERSV